MPAEMNVTSVYSPQADDDDIATLEKDLLLNMLIVVLLLIGGPSFLAQADLAGQTAQTAQGEAVKIFIEDDGDLHLGSLTSAHIGLETLPSALQNMVGADSTSVPGPSYGDRAGRLGSRSTPGGGPGPQGEAAVGAERALDAEV